MFFLIHCAIITFNGKPRDKFLFFIIPRGQLFMLNFNKEKNIPRRVMNKTSVHGFFSKLFSLISGIKPDSLVFIS